ncbi:spermidine synthase [Terracoccus luteus]|uniref:Spermidine synthase n=1 Tax=Terracoccus luteus TaxID=53356 RepID=A0A839PZ98_9MICO|nr:spermidine synthase [Terracoccus luteus]MBB2987326.1 spermidine synthase [Terracoccus luteus]MCP2172977.1 spermidine synthase [Terracoccus luteus]
MSRRLEEIDWQSTPLGDLMLRRRREPTTGREIYEVKLGEEFLMSSLFTVAEIELAHLGLAAARPTGPTGIHDAPDLDVVVGGLGLGYTLVAALESDRVRSVRVIEALAPVISWHERHLLPDTVAATDDPRTTFVHDDFFAWARRGGPPGVDVVLLDVDHTPEHHLHPSHADLYTPDGLRSLAGHLRPEGVFALWSDDPPDPAFVGVLSEVFVDVEGVVVDFPNPITGSTSSNSVYTARWRPGHAPASGPTD